MSGDEFVVWDDTRVCVWFYPMRGSSGSPLAWRYEVLFKDTAQTQEYTEVKSAKAVRIILGIVRQAWRQTLSENDFLMNRYRHD